MGGGISLGVEHGLYETVMIDSAVRLTNKDFNVHNVP